MKGKTPLLSLWGGWINLCGEGLMLNPELDTSPEGRVMFLMLERHCRKSTLQAGHCHRSWAFPALQDPTTAGLIPPALSPFSQLGTGSQGAHPALGLPLARLYPHGGCSTSWEKLEIIFPPRNSKPIKIPADGQGCVSHPSQHPDRLPKETRAPLVFLGEPWCQHWLQFSPRVWTLQWHFQIPVSWLLNPLEQRGNHCLGDHNPVY